MWEEDAQQRVIEDNEDEEEDDEQHEQHEQDEQDETAANEDDDDDFGDDFDEFAEGGEDDADFGDFDEADAAPSQPPPPEQRQPSAIPPAPDILAGLVSSMSESHTTFFQTHLHIFPYTLANTWPSHLLTSPI
jgi:hypothetical protein